MFMEPPQVGRSYPVADRVFTVLRIDPYTRERDGEASSLVVWETTCIGCQARLEFKTGRHMGDMARRCVPCLRIAEQVKIDSARRDRTCSNPVPVDVIWQAVRTLGDRPVSLARNTSRRNLYAPALLRETCPDLLKLYTHEDIRAGLMEAIYRGLVGWQVAGRYRSGNARRGLYARPAEYLRRQGLLGSEPTPQGVFS